MRTPPRASARVAAIESQLAWFGAALIATAFAFHLAGTPEWIPGAPIVMAGIASPLSGMSRSFVALAGGDVARAFWWHPLGPPCFAACGFAVIVGVTMRFGATWSRLHSLTGHRWVWLGVAAAFGAAWTRQIVVLGT